MHILVEPSDYTLNNAGDMAMLQVACARLRRVWPHACIQVFSDEPDVLVRFCPGVHPLTTRGRQMWFADGYLFGSLRRVLPSAKEAWPWAIERSLRRHRPAAVRATMRSRMRASGVDCSALDEFWRVVTGADLVVVAGMGGITDAFEEYACELLDTLALAMRHGVSTALFGQGIGPIRRPRLRARARTVLSRVELIALREGRAGRPLLQSLGLAPEQIRVTGDDAVELAYQRRSEQIGSGIGVNVRIGQYAEVDSGLVARLGVILQDIARRYRAPLVPVPISRYPVDADAAVIRQLCAGYPDVQEAVEELDTPPAIIRQIQHCRVVVTGSYHAAVFALAQGIPAVGLAKSAYYVDKFLGLAEQFGRGCSMVSLDEADLPGALRAAIDELWRAAPQVRPHLLAAAARQIALSQEAYRHLDERMTARGGAAGGYQPLIGS